MKKPYQILIIPLTIYSGIEQGFLSAEYTAVSIILIETCLQNEQK